MYSVRSCNDHVRVLDEKTGTYFYKPFEMYEVLHNGSDTPLISTTCRPAAISICFMLNGLSREDGEEALRAIGEAMQKKSKENVRAVLKTIREPQRRRAKR